MQKREALLAEAAKEEALEVITEWKHFWMNQKQHSQADYENYRDRAMGVDANMKHDLATRIATWEAQRSAVLLEALEEIMERTVAGVIRVERGQPNGLDATALDNIARAALEKYRGNRGQDRMQSPAR